ncbi:MAG: hypothetical protein ACLQLH_12625 [Terracidiphilus sp.]
MNVRKFKSLVGRKDASSTPGIPTGQGEDFAQREYNVRTGIDVSADGPGVAILAAIEEMGLQNPEAFCYHVEHIQSGRKWEVELFPSGEIEVEDWNS